MSTGRRGGAKISNLKRAMGLSLDQQRGPGKFKPISGLIPMSDLDLMIANGWGLTPRDKIPADWRTRHKPTTR